MKTSNVRFHLFTTLLVALLAAAHPAQGQVVFTETYHDYTEDFSSLTYGVDQPWMDNKTLPGWFYLPTFGSGSDVETRYVYTEGPNGLPGLQLYTDTNTPPTIRALGSLTNGGVENGFWISRTILGFSIQNDGNSVIDALSVSFDQVQWYGGTAAAQDVMEFSYSTDATDLESGTWTTVSELDIRDLKNGQGAVPVTVTPRSATLSNVGWKVGGAIWFRWVDKQAEGGNAGAGIANVKVSVTK